MKNTKVNEVVRYSCGCFDCHSFYGYEGQEVYFNETEIVGNIHNNPELLKEEE